MCLLLEDNFSIYEDRNYRRQTKYIILASIGSMIPTEGGLLDPSIWGGGGNSEFTWARVQEFFYYHPISIRKQLPMHFYSEFLQKDYVHYVGLPLSNRSWFMAKAVETGLLPIMYLDSIVIVLQENFAIENVESRLWKLLAHNVVTPLMRMLDISRLNVQFFEKIVDQKKAEGIQWPFAFRYPTYLDPIQFDMQLKQYEKR
jgi:hypothetical protein